MVWASAGAMPSHRLDRDGDELVWTDHENRRTRFPIPDAQRPAITNRLSRAAIYLGGDPSELILAQAGESRASTTSAKTRTALT